MILQIQPHGVDAQQAIFWLPRLRCHAQQLIFPRACCQCSNAGVNAIHIGLQQRALCGCLRLQDTPGHLAKMIAAYLCIDVIQRRAQQSGELARRAAAQQIHLKKSLLGMQKSRGSSHIETTLADDARHTGGIALNTHRGGQTGQATTAL